MSKVIARTRENHLHGPAHKLECCICWKDDRNKLKVEDIGIAVGISGDDYSFCEECWDSDDLGEKILGLLGYDRIKILDEELEFGDD